MLPHEQYCSETHSIEDHHHRVSTRRLHCPGRTKRSERTAKGGFIDQLITLSEPRPEKVMSTFKIGIVIVALATALSTAAYAAAPAKGGGGGGGHAAAGGGGGGGHPGGGGGHAGGGGGHAG